jgi:hypothetical protein
MRLVTIQDQAAYDELRAKGVLRCKPELSEMITGGGHPSTSCRPAYDWLVGQMKQRLGPAPRGVAYPIWAWYRYDYKPVKVDFRKAPFIHYCRGEHYALTIEVPDEAVLLSDFLDWHRVLNDGYLCAAKNESGCRKEDDWFDSLPPGEQRKTKEKSWERVFDIAPYENDWRSKGRYVQATCWELRWEQVVTARRFVGRRDRDG